MYPLLLALLIAAAGGEPLARDEVAGIKKKLIAVAAAVGQPPSGYVKDSEDFQLPTDAYRQKDGKLDWVTPSMRARFGGGGEKTAQKSQEQAGKDYEKKLAEAMAKGDYDAMQRLGEEMQKQSGQAHLAAIEGRKDPIELEISLNSSESQAVDPDAVVFEKPGVIALLVDAKDEKGNRLKVFIDPVALKETKTLSRVTLGRPEGGASKKTSVYNATVVLVGPPAEIKAWARRLNTAAVLGQIDSGR